MTRRAEPLAKLAFLGAFAALGLVSYATIIRPSIEDEARQALARHGFQVQHLEPAAWPVCPKGRTGFFWRTADQQGSVCVGGYLPPDVSSWR